MGGQNKLWVGSQQKEQILKTLQRDVEFLSSQNLMDYSLLVGIHDPDVVSDRDTDAEESAPEYDYATASSYESDEEIIAISNQPAPSSSNLDKHEKRLPKVNMFHSSPDAPKKEVYFLMIIDVLTNYGVKKWTAHTAKTIKHGADAEFSTVAPDTYAKRFIDFISTILS